MSHNVMIEGKMRECVNEDDNFWGKYYLVSFAQCLGWDSAVLINADNDQNAVDYAADYHEEKGHMGYFLDPADKRTQELEKFDELVHCGNHCLPVHMIELNVRRVKPQ